MLKDGRMILLLGVTLGMLVVGGLCNGDGPADWEPRDSYILVTDTVSVIYVLDDTGMVVGSLAPLVDSMEGIHSPTLVGRAEQVAFLSKLKPSDSKPYLCIVDPSGEELKVTAFRPDDIDGSPGAREVVFTIVSGSNRRIYLMDSEDGSASLVCADTAATSDAVGTVLFEQALEPAFSPDGATIAFVNVGTYFDTDIGGWVPRRDVGLVGRDGSNYRLLTGDIDGTPLPPSTWIDLCWTHNGDWILVFEKNAQGTLNSVYAVQAKDESGNIYSLQYDYMDSYTYASTSPTGDTIVLGTAPSHADVYLIEFESPPDMPGPRTRISQVEYFAEPDWGPGAE